MKIKKRYIFFLLFLIVVPIRWFCYNYIEFSPIERNDIYNKCPKDNKISYGLFRNTQRIIKSDDKYFIWLDLYDEGNVYDQYAEHLLICDSNLILKGAGYFATPIALITSVKNDTVYSWSSDTIIEEKKSNILRTYRNDLPPEINLKYIRRKRQWNGLGRRCNTVIDSISFLPNQFSVKIYAKISANNSWDKKDYYSPVFDSYQVIELPVSCLCFSRSRKYLYVYEEYNTLNEMYILNESIIESLYYNIWKNISQ